MSNINIIVSQISKTILHACSRSNLLTTRPLAKAFHDQENIQKGQNQTNIVSKFSKCSMLAVFSDQTIFVRNKKRQTTTCSRSKILTTRPLTKAFHDHGKLRKGQNTVFIFVKKHEYFFVLGHLLICKLPLALESIQKYLMDTSTTVM